MGASAWAMFATVAKPNHVWNACRVGCPGCGLDGAHIQNASSLHAGGVNATMGDGSVRFIKDSIALNVWWALGTRAGGEALSSDAY